MTLLKRLINGWTLLKFIRVGLGSLILYSSVEGGHIAGMIFGGLFTIISLLTDGVCCAGAWRCYNPGNKNISSINEMTEYEELDSK